MNKQSLPDRYYSNKKSAKKLSDVFKNPYFKIIKKKNRDIDKYQDVWNKVVDDNINKHGRVSVLKNGVLYIEIDSHVWLHHITNFCKDEILSTFQNCKDVRFISEVKFKLKQ